MTVERVLLDANILFPTVLRELLIGAAGAGGFVPLWSPRILEEWARATRRLGPGAEAIARAEIAVLRADWPGSEIAPPPALIESLDLPDADDRHVLAAAIAGGARTLLTRNRADFPDGRLAPYGITRREPDGFLLELWHGGHDLRPVAAEVRARAERAGGEIRDPRALLKRAGLPRLGKALSP